MNGPQGWLAAGTKVQPDRHKGGMDIVDRNRRAVTRVEVLGHHDGLSRTAAQLPGVFRPIDQRNIVWAGIVNWCSPANGCLGVAENASADQLGQFYKCGGHRAESFPGSVFV